MSCEDCPNDVFKILVATDNHLGYGEKKPQIAEDSFRAFEEILQLAIENSVDFLLLGGDLFHDCNPSSYAIYKCQELLHRYCLGDKPIEFEILSDKLIHFSHLKKPIVNYEDPNLNISVPIFTIHGNHDDPVGQKQLSALDIISSTGLINYIGHKNQLSEVKITPILFSKGETKLALYGLSHIKDERLGRLFIDKKVTFCKPLGKWFHLLVLHQNRVDRGRKNFVPESALPDFLDLVIWGHEHNCIIEPMKSIHNVFISQPGSSVVTSLCVGESIEKKVGFLSIYKDKFLLKPIPLKSVRPFVYMDYILEGMESYEKELPKLYATRKVKEQMEDMIDSAEKKQKDSKIKLKPSIRLIVHYEDERLCFNPIRLGQEFTDRIVNPDNAILLKRILMIEKSKYIKFDKKFLEEMGKPEDYADRAEDVVKKYFENEERSEKLLVCSLNGLLEASKRFVDQNDVEALDLVIKYQSDATLKKLKQISPDPSKAVDVLKSLRKERQTRDKDDVSDLVKLLNTENRVIKRLPINSDENEVSVVSNDDESDDSDFPSNVVTSIRGNESCTGQKRERNATPKKERGRGTRGSRGTRGKK